MECLVWMLRTMSGFEVGAPLAYSLLVLLLLCWDYLLLFPAFLLRQAWRGFAGGSAATRAPGPVPSALIVIPSLLRERAELTSMFSTIESVATNGYSGRLVIVVSIDGFDDAPALFAELREWAHAQLPPMGHSLHVTGTPGRRGKPMAIDHGLEFVRDLVEHGQLPAFPEVYISTDADADLGPMALEHLVRRLIRRNWLTGAPGKAVAGNLYVRGNDFWRGWREFFTIRGQLTLQVAREYMVTNVARHNLRWMPLSGVPGVLYCTWTDILLEAPRFLGYLRSLRTRDWLGWWIGREPPPFTGTDAAPIVELMAGDTDDTVSAYMASIARWENGRFSFDPPATPVHALLHLLRSVLVERALRYEPEARVYTSSPTSIRSLFKQRKRWNASRIEVTLRFRRALGYHWSLGAPALGVMFLIGRYCLVGGLMYLALPLGLLQHAILGAFVLGYLFQFSGYSLLTLMALAMNGSLRHWRLVLAMPLCPLYAICFTYTPTVVGAFADVFGFGNVTGFAPESTLVRGGSYRLALAFRIRRAFSLMLRSLVVGDVPLGWFWLGWGKTEWTPNGYEGWTTKKRPASIVPPVRQWFGPRTSREGRALLGAFWRRRAQGRLMPAELHIEGRVVRAQAKRALEL
ncbi:MAG TPA: glycosyltransferase family 2 protein [Polyangiaceae bacterium]|nr:glycosyltransferase family 2 protein [Polyangiaceae bacterium]